MGDNDSEYKREYIKSWMKGCFFSYLKGKGSVEQLRAEIERARKFGMTGEDFQIIIDALPFCRNLQRFQDILKILREKAQPSSPSR